MAAPTGTTNTRQRSTQTAVYQTKYTKSPDISGWLMVKNSSTNESIYLCEYTQVLIQRVSGGYTFFLIKDGHYKNIVAKMSTSNADKYLISFTRGNGATLRVSVRGRKNELSNIRNERLNQLFSILTFNGKTARITIDSDVTYKETNRNSPDYGKVKKSKPLPYGRYKIMIPDFAKDQNMTSFYRTSRNGFSGLKYDRVWFPIEYAPTHNSNFVHVGHLSEGCITCYEIPKWNDIYDYLIKNRTSDGYIGELIIEDGTKIKEEEKGVLDKISDWFSNLF